MQPKKTYAGRKDKLFRNVGSYLTIYVLSSPGGLELESTVQQNFVLVNWKPCGNNTAKKTELQRSAFISQIVSFLFLPVGTNVRAV
jgi:hypothetical protein